jgi:hypothetical protein
MFAEATQSIEFLDETGRSPAQRQVQAGAPETISY